MRNRRRFQQFVAIGALSAGLSSVGSATAVADDGSIVLDLVRHGQTLSNLNGIIDTAPPGASLDATGVEQANAVADSIYAQFGNDIVGVFASQADRTVQTAAPLADLLNITTPIPELAGLNEIPAGVFEGQPTASLAGILYLLGPIAWTLGFPLVPDLGDPTVNGVTFDESFGLAVQTIYDGTVGSNVDPATAVAFSSAGSIAVWTLMNVNNPDFSILFDQVVDTQEFLPNTGQVIIEGSPGDWTLVSYNGVPVPQDPGLLTNLFVDFRDLIEAPQIVGYDIYQALLTGDAATIDAALLAGYSQIETAFSQFPVDVFDHIVDAIGGSL